MRVRVAGSPAGSWRRSSAWTTYVPLDHLVHEIRWSNEHKWSNRTQVVQAERPRHDMRDTAPPCGTIGERNGVGRRNRPSSDAVGPFPRRDVRPALESSGRNRLLESEIHSRCQEAPGARHRDPRGRAPGGRSRGPARPIGMPPWSSSGSRRPPGPAAARVVQICCKGPGRAEMHEKKR